jgi:TusA-related sulfurtransferase
VPVLELAQAMRTAEVGDVVDLLADDPAAVADVQAWCEATGHTLLTLQQGGGQVRAQVQKRSQG